MKNLDPEIVDIIDHYLRGELSDEEERAFENRLEKDEALRTHYQLLKDVALASEYNELSKLKHSLKTVSDENFIKKYRYWLVAASIALVALFTIIFGYERNRPSSEDLFATYYQPYPNVVAPASRSGEEVDLGMAYRFYEKEDYQAALKLWEDLTDINDTIRFYQAQALLSLDQPQQAIDHLNAIPHTSLFVEPAEWYLALAFLKKGEIERSLALIDSIIEREGSYEKKASQLRKQLR